MLVRTSAPAHRHRRCQTREDLALKFISNQVGRSDVEVEVPGIGARFEGSAGEAVTLAQRADPTWGEQLLIVSDGPVRGEEPTGADIVREIRERADGRGWNTIEDAHDHGSGDISARNAVTYILQRRHEGRLLEIRVRDPGAVNRFKSSCTMLATKLPCCIPELMRQAQQSPRCVFFVHNSS
jgi:hypothetical protein